MRLCEATRKFAMESLQGKYGTETALYPFVHVDCVENWDALNDHQKYTASLDVLVRECPLRICEGERICGAATLGAGIRHQYPAARDGRVFWPSVSHLTVDFGVLVREGILGMRERIANLSTESFDEVAMMRHTALLATLDAMQVWHGRYLEATKEKYPQLHELLLRVPLHPAKSFTEAVQSLWFGFAFLRLGGNWPGIGCIDRLLGPYLKRDLAEGKITMDEAREVLASMFIKGCEWIETDTARGSGDAQHYQNIVLGGTDADGSDVTNEVSYLCLEVVEELGISDFPISVRLNKKTPKDFLRLLARVMRHGGGVVAVYNEDTVFAALRAQGYPEADIYDFANDGCWEVQIPGKTYFSYMPMDFLHLLLQGVLHVAEGELADFADMDALKAAYAERMKQHIEGTCESVLSGTVPEWREGSDVFRPAFPTPMIDLFEHGCAESGRGYLEGGTPYVVISPHMGGVGDVANALCAIDHLCFIEKRMSVSALCEILRNDWNGQEQLALYAKHKLPHYGNGDAAADAYYAWAVDAFADACAKYAKGYPIAFPPGISTFGRQIEWMVHRTAVPHGYRRGEILAGNTSPTPGTDTAGATATVRSYCAADLSRMTTGAALDIKLYPGTLDGENGLCALEGLMQGFCALGGYFMQVDVLDVQTLLDAREHPEQYKTLSVRVSGWNARFVTLDDAWQRMVLERAGYVPEEQA